MPLNAHEEFRELCAVATSGCLTEEEQAKLEVHLASCRECRAVLWEFERVATVVMPALVDDFPDEHSDDFPDSSMRWSEEDAKQGFFDRLSQRDSSSRDRADGPVVERIHLQSLGIRKTRQSFALQVLPYAAALFLAAAMGWFGYRIGAEHSASSARVVDQTTAPKVSSTAEPVADFAKQRESLSVQVEQRDRAIANLTEKVAHQTAEVEKLLQEQSRLNDSLQKAQTERDQRITEREALDHNLADSQTQLAQAKKELETLQQQRANDGPREAELEARLAKFSDQLKDRDAKIDEQRDLLARDKDIRDLMGARELYIAEVQDVAGNGETKKPIGRVFYTQGKSLIFYAYDLDQQPGLRNASTFQAWGRRGPELSQSVSMGIFYADSAAHKRWVLKFNDAKSLSQIDAVFVTVEPNGGSQKPTGKQLLFAYLRVEPNHP